MSILLLSLLFAVLLVMGVYLQPRLTEPFIDMDMGMDTPGEVSPTLAALLNRSDMPVENISTVDALSRDAVLQQATSEGFEVERPKKKKSTCSKKKSGCPVCPDMSKYIRLDEVPCWNCSLP